MVCVGHVAHVKCRADHRDALGCARARSAWRDGPGHVSHERSVGHPGGAGTAGPRWLRVRAPAGCCCSRARGGLWCHRVCAPTWRHSQGTVRRARAWPSATTTVARSQSPAAPLRCTNARVHDVHAVTHPARTHRSPSHYCLLPVCRPATLQVHGGGIPVAWVPRVPVPRHGRHAARGTLHTYAVCCSLRACFNVCVCLAPPLSGPRPLGRQPFAVETLGCAAGVMVTASHNPRQDNGFKVYWDNGAQVRSTQHGPSPAAPYGATDVVDARAQIVPPHDTGIGAHIEENLAPWQAYDTAAVLADPNCLAPEHDVRTSACAHAATRHGLVLCVAHLWLCAWHG